LFHDFLAIPTTGKAATKAPLTQTLSLKGEGLDAKSETYRLSVKGTGYAPLPEGEDQSEGKDDYSNGTKKFGEIITKNHDMNPGN